VLLAIGHRAEEDDERADHRPLDEDIGRRGDVECDAAEANPYIDVPLATGMGEMRNALIVRAAQAAIAIGGGWGTLSEIAMAQRIKTPVVGLHDAFPSAIDIPRVSSPAAAVAWALEQAARPEV